MATPFDRPAAQLHRGVSAPVLVTPSLTLSSMELEHLARLATAVLHGAIQCFNPLSDTA